MGFETTNVCFFVSQPNVDWKLVWEMGMKQTTASLFLLSCCEYEAEMTHSRTLISLELTVGCWLPYEISGGNLANTREVVPSCSRSVIDPGFPVFKN